MTGLPDQMRAVEISEPGGPEVLKPMVTTVPKPGPGQVLIKVAVAGVNRPDALQRAGAYPPPKDASPLPGLEVAGTIAALGEGVNDRQVGDRVMALTPGGGYAEFCLTAAGHCLPIPDGFSLAEAGAVPETYFTVWSNLFLRGGLKAGETVLIHGGSSGIGTTAIQLAKSKGAKVLVTVGNEEKAKACAGLGADRAINYREEDYVAVAKEMTGGNGVDVVLDMVGGDYVARNLQALREDGRHISIAFLRGAKVELDLRAVMVRRITMMGSTLRPQSVEAKSAIADSLTRDVLPLLADGTVKPVMHASFPLDQAADAHALMESSTHIGKIVLIVDPEAALG